LFKNIWSPKNNGYLALFVFHFYFAHSQSSHHWNIRQRFELMAFDGRFESALAQTNIEYSPQGIAFITHHLLFLKALIYQDPSSLLEFETKSPILLQQIQNHSRFPYTTFFISEIYFERAMIALLKEELITAANLLKKAYHFAQKSLSTNPEIKEPYRIIGLIQVGLSSLPSSYQKIAEVLGYETDMKKAITHFEQTTYGPGWLILENKLILYFLYKHFLRDLHSTDSILNQLISIENPPALFLCLKASDALEKRQPDSALYYLHFYLNEENLTPYRFPYVHFLAGKAYFLKGNYVKAQFYLKNFLDHYSGKAYVALANLYLGFCSLFDNNGKELESYLKRVTESPARLEVDKEAQYLAKHILQHGVSQMEIQFLKIRFLVDGGHFQQALNALESIRPKLATLTNDQKTMFYYYLARIYHFQKQYYEAKTHYRLTLHQPTELYKWMHAYAAFYLGQILEEEQDWEPARRYYRQALSYPIGPYQQSIETYAKAALERLKEKRYEINAN